MPLSTLEGSTQRFDSRAISALEDMLAAMEAEGLSPAVCSGYRTRETPGGRFTPGRWTFGWVWATASRTPRPKPA